MARKLLISAVLVTLAPVLGAAQPVITQVTGTWQDGEELVLTGQFGDKGTVAAPLLWDTLDNQPSYAGLEHGDIIPSQNGNWDMDPCPECPWKVNQEDWTDPMLYWDQDHRTAAHHPYYHTTTKGYFRMGDLGDQYPKQFYISWWFRTSAPDPTIGSNKFVRLWAATERAQGFMSWTSSHMTYTADTNHNGISDYIEFDDANTSWHRWLGSSNEWHHLELLFDGSGDLQHGYGIVYAVSDGDTVHSIHDATGDMPWNRLFVFGWDASYRSNFIGETFDFSEVYIDTVLARVIVGNAPVIDQVTHMEMQIPVSWSSDRIVVTGNTGSFGPGEDTWLYVYDNENRVNHAGYPLTAPDPGPPGEPGKPERQ